MWIFFFALFLVPTFFFYLSISKKIKEKTKEDERVAEKILNKNKRNVEDIIDFLDLFYTYDIKKYEHFEYQFNFNGTFYANDINDRKIKVIIKTIEAKTFDSLINKLITIIDEKIKLIRATSSLEDEITII